MCFSYFKYDDDIVEYDPNEPFDTTYSSYMDTSMVTECKPV